MQSATFTQIAGWSYSSLERISAVYITSASAVCPVAQHVSAASIHRSSWPSTDAFRSFCRCVFASAALSRYSSAIPSRTVRSSGMSAGVLAARTAAAMASSAAAAASCAASFSLAPRSLAACCTSLATAVASSARSDALCSSASSFIRSADASISVTVSSNLPASILSSARMFTSVGVTCAPPCICIKSSSVVSARSAFPTL
mmetsp:Transcript_14597/g.52546  ORF Transcript_14597/g.52546 Transcript_14597/m.52546 type:complete len:202 (-) Transcript_14597:594-1199(-)